MNRFQTLCGLIALLGAAFCLVTISATAQSPTPIPSVWLQSSTPGTQQTGNARVSGTGLFGKIGVNTLSPFATFDVNGTTEMYGTSSGAGNSVLHVTNSSNDILSYAVKAQSNSSGFNSAAVFGVYAGTGDSYGVYGQAQSAAGGIGVYGEHTATTGIASGVEGHTNSTASGGLYPGASGVLGLVTSTSPGAHSAGVRGVNSGQGSEGSGVIGVHFGNGNGVYGAATSGSSAVGGRFQGRSSGVFGESVSSTGQTNGVFGYNASTEGRALTGFEVADTGVTYGVFGFVQSTAGTGVFGHATATSGITTGIYGQTDSTSGYGAFGYASRTTGSSVGGRFQSDSPTGIGVHGYCPSTSGLNYGVYGATDSTAGVGVYGIAPQSSGTSVGVWGVVNSANGWGVFANGRLGASGTKSFRIDHPLDPLNKYLLHYCSEGPEPLNVYSGSVTTDDKGYANVALPDYYDSINRDPKIQLTVVDEQDSDAFVMVKVVELPKDSAFRIRSSVPRAKVFWRVEAVRNDEWVKKYGAEVEQEKPAGEKGKYQHPELYGAPKEMAMSYRPEFRRPK